MYIKQITIQGFKSYKDQTTFDPFSPQHNVIVGRNGSGKSNFFSAIRFVLGDAYTNLTKEERQSLLHEGVGSATISAYVEIVFNNADNRLPVDKLEVTLKRSIGLSLDEYSLDGKPITKSDVKNLFESIGFSSANPYFVVPQGKINSLTVAKDKDRLELLKDIAGTSVYEEKRKESTGLMQETDTKRVKITEVLEYIQERLDQLEEEKDELSQFQLLDRDRRSLEYTIYAREQADSNTKLEELEETRRRDLEVRDSKREEYNDNDTSLTALENNKRDLMQSLQVKEMDKTELQDELDDLMKLRTQLELQIKDLEENQLSDTELEAKITAQIGQLDSEIATKEHQVNEISPRYESIQKSDHTLRQQLETLKVELEGLYAKQARLSQYKNRAERDQWLQKQIQDLSVLYKDVEQQIETLSDEKEAANEHLLQKTQRIQDIQEKVSVQRLAKEKLLDEEIQVKEERDQLTEARKNLWREEAGLDSSLTNCKNEIHKAERALSGSMDKNTSIGLSAISRITKEYNIDGVHGPLFELFEVDERFRTAVEVAAGSSLFHVVVDTDETATKLLEAMNAEKGGRVTFVPLNRVKSTPSEYPTANDAIPLIQKLRFNDMYQKAFEQIFGRTLVCPSLDVAASYAKSRGFTVVTLNGDRVDNRGAFSGGFTDFRHSRLEAAKTLKTQRTALEQNQQRVKTIKTDVEKLNQQVTQALNALQQVETKKKKIQLQEEPVELIAKLRKEEDYCTKLIASKEKSLDKARTNLAHLKQQMSGYETELQSEPTQSLSTEEQAIVMKNRAEMEGIRQQLSEISETKLSMENEIDGLKASLENDLQRKRTDLINKRDRADANTSAEELAQRTKEHKAVVRKLGKLAKRITELDNEIDANQDRLAKYTEEYDQLTSMQTKLTQDIARLEKHLERYLYRRSILHQRKEECNANIRDLGVLPEEAFGKFKAYSVERLLRRLHKANEGLKKYNHVNKKAFEQYTRFTKQREQLSTRKNELDTSAESIRTLVESLDRRKNEAIERTFNEVSTNFTDIFETLVPAGRGELVMKRQVETTQYDMDVDEGSSLDLIERYSGVAIKVSFNSQSDEGMIMQQLSGGQKSLVALALIFAIQKCDPAPFYLFDEIDANLDMQYRTAVAEMIHSLSKNAQFITTTFRPELLAEADKFYGVTFQNKVSRIHAIAKEYALGFVEEEQAH
ncbi:putative chromosome segregation protein SudA [Absidia repens]|uniref:Structural maintenance of chromosomes protein n=1 Tax=Absidia repens TaxID=90262 RepID=A0A1X2IK24_9FUNG|nr:putative chromosome segregation protein SudA [Absidia repens]